MYQVIYLMKAIKNPVISDRIFIEEVHLIIFSLELQETFVAFHQSGRSYHS
jgi:hypothetical protein